MESHSQCLILFFINFIFSHYLCLDDLIFIYGILIIIDCINNHCDIMYVFYKFV